MCPYETPIYMVTIEKYIVICYQICNQKRWRCSSTQKKYKKFVLWLIFFIPFNGKMTRRYEINNFFMYFLANMHFFVYQ